MTGFDIPVVMNVPVEVSAGIDEEVEQDVTYANLKQAQLKKLMNNPKSTLKKVGDYLLMNYLKGAISYEEISEALDLTDTATKLRVAQLNFFNEFPITMIPVPKMKGYIQSCLRNEAHYERWDLKKQRTILSMTEVKRKAKKINGSKQKATQEIKIKVKHEAKESS